MKPSELSPRSAALLAHLLPLYLDTKAYAIVNGAIPQTTALLGMKFDHIFYTGGSVVGRIVALAAAKNLTPTVLELGGLSPCIVAEDANIEVAAKRIAWGEIRLLPALLPAN